MKIKTRPTTPQNIDFSKEMQPLLQEAYRLFDRKIGKTLNVCKPCCISEEREQELVQTPVSNLSVSAIYDYLDAVHYDEAGYEIKHFLPRILELLVKGENIRHSTEITLDKCHFEKSCWSEAELDYMRRFSGEFIKNILTLSPFHSRVEPVMDYILMFDLAGLTTVHLLEIWQDLLAKSDTAFWHFVKVIYYDTDDSDLYYHNSFSVNPDSNQQVYQWFQAQKSVIPIIENQYMNDTQLTDKEIFMLESVYSKMVVLT